MRYRTPAFLFTVAVAAAVLAAPAPSTSPLLDRLGSADYAEREAATGDLLRDDSVNLDGLRALFADAALPEQRHRLLDAIRHHTLRQIREESFAPEGDPAIGFSHDIRRRARALPGGSGGEEASAVFVVSTLPGFPGYAHLKPGDLITEIDGQPLPPELDNELFKDRLRRRTHAGREAERRAGDPIRLTVVRDGRRIPVELELATIESLERMYTQSPILQEPFNSRWRQMRDDLLTTAPPIPTVALPPAR